MMTSAIYGLAVLPAAVADERGSTVVVQRAASAAWLERLLRPVCTEMGCSAGFSSCPLTGQPACSCLRSGAVLQANLPKWPAGLQALQRACCCLPVCLPASDCRPAAEAGGGAPLT
jgi:hypothetical protein